MTYDHSLDDTHVDDLLRRLVQYGGTELRLTAGSPPLIVEQADRHPLSAEILLPTQVERLCYDVLADVQITEYEAQGEFRFVYPLPRCGEFQAHFWRTENGPDALFQRI